MRITKKTAKELIEVLDEIRREFFKDKLQYQFREWERKREKVKEKLQDLPRLVEEAASKVRVCKERGRDKKLNLAQRTMLFLFARLFGKSNRDMEFMLILLKPLFKIEISYKTIERLYSDEEVKACLHNLFLLLLDSKRKLDCAGDGTGYSLTITKNYRSNPKKRGKDFRYIFRVIDLDTGYVVGFGYSKNSEKEAFERAIAMLEEMGIKFSSIRLDKYYSSRKVIRRFGKGIALYLLPKRNISRLGLEWYRIFRAIIYDPFNFLREYFKRNLCESYFSSDKRRFGWVIRQKREDRIEQALFAITVLHNLFSVRVRVE